MTTLRKWLVMLAFTIFMMLIAIGISVSEARAGKQIVTEQVLLPMHEPAVYVWFPDSVDGR